MKLPVKNQFFFGFWREVRNISRSRPLLIALFLYPLITIFGMFYLFNQEVINDIPIAVVDLDKTSSSRNLIQNISADSSIEVVARYDSLSGAKEAILSGEVFGILLIPNDFEKLMLGGFQPEVTAFSNLQYMSMGLTLASGFTQAFASDLMLIQTQKLGTQGADMHIAQQQLTPIMMDLHPVFNPTLSYMYTLVNGIIPVVIQVIIMLSVAYSVIQDQFSSRGILGALRNNQDSIFCYLFNKILPYALIFMFFLCVFDFGLIYFFDIPFNGSVTFEIISGWIFIYSAALCAVVFSIYSPDRALSYGAVSIFSSPAFGFIGLFFPRISMNAFAHIWGSILPVTWYMEGRLDQTLRDAGLIEAVKTIGAMSLIGLVAYLLIVIRIEVMKKGASKNV